MEKPSEYRHLLAASGLKQRELAAILSIDPTTVNRWDGEGQQARPAPGYALQFLRAWIMLTPAQRDRLRPGQSAGK